MRERKDAYRILVGNSEGKRPLGRSTLRRQENIEMNVQEIGQKHGLD
jgi:hypothetical protein